MKSSPENLTQECFLLYVFFYENCFINPITVTVHKNSHLLKTYSLYSISNKI